MITFSNPRLTALFEDWPLGGNQRGRCEIKVESHPKRGFRFVKTTTGKPKTATFGGGAVIVDGSDGRTYLIQHAGAFDFINIWGHDFKCPDSKVLGGDSSVFPRDSRYESLKALIAQCYGVSR